MATNLGGSRAGCHPPAGEFIGSEARQFLELIGRDPKTVWLRSIDPRKQRSNGPDTRSCKDWIKRKTDDRFNVYAVVGVADQASGGGGGVKDADVSSCPTLFVEWDDGASIDEQSQRWRAFGLPEPTVMVATGGKSVHAYWRLSEPLDPKPWRVLTRRLIEHCASDPQCCNPSRVMRLPGSVYYDKKTGEPTGRCRIIASTGNSYSVAEIEACLPVLPPPAPAPQQQHQPRSIEQINAAAEYIPRRVGGEGTYEHDRNALCGCSAALADAGVADPDGAAVALLGHKWPTEAEARQVVDTTTTRRAESFWAIAGEHGFNLKRTTRSEPVKAISSTGINAVVEARGIGWVKREDGPPKRQQIAVGDLSGRLRQVLGDRLGFDELAMLPAVDGVALEPHDIELLHVRLSENGWIIAEKAAVDALMLTARERPFHPIREYLKRVEADRSIEPFNLDKVATKFFRVRSDSKLHIEMVRRWLIGAVARAMEPGCQMDHCLVLQGGQGLGKSTALRALASPDWFCCTVPDQDKDLTLNVHSCWIYELAELEALTGRKAAGHLKNMLTTATDLVRVPFGKAPERMRRGSVFAATVNKREFLRDDTGNRRFWVVPIEGTEKLDREGLAGARDAIWKAAVKAWRDGELPMLSDELAEASEEQNANYQEQDPWLPLLADHLEGKSGPVKVNEVLDHLEVPKERQSPGAARRVRELAESIGWSWGRRRDGDTRAQGLWPPKGHPKATQATQAATQAKPSQGNGSDAVATQATQKNGNELTIKGNGTQENIPLKRAPETAFFGGLGGHPSKTQSGKGKSLGGQIGGLGGQIGGLGGHPPGSAWDGGAGDDPHWPARRAA